MRSAIPEVLDPESSAVTRKVPTGSSNIKEIRRKFEWTVASDQHRAYLLYAWQNYIFHKTNLAVQYSNIIFSIIPSWFRQIFLNLTKFSCSSSCAPWQVSHSGFLKSVWYSGIFESHFLGEVVGPRTLIVVYTTFRISATRINQSLCQNWTIGQNLSINKF